MSKPLCSTCQSPHTTLVCGLCKSDICKACAHVMDDEDFKLHPSIPENLKHHIYCLNCFDDVVSPQLEIYKQNLELAKKVSVFFKSHSKVTRGLDRQEPPIQVIDCDDYDEAILRMAFVATLSKYNTLIDVEMISKKIKLGGYRTTIWSGSGIPTYVDPIKVERIGRLK